MSPLLLADDLRLALPVVVVVVVALDDVDDDETRDVVTAAAAADTVPSSDMGGERTGSHKAIRELRGHSTRFECFFFCWL